MSGPDDRTKSVVFMGVTYKVPEWVEYVAQDRDGTINGFQYEPKKQGGWYWGCAGKAVQLFRPEAQMICEKV